MNLDDFAEQTLRNALANNLKPEGLWALDATLTDFYAAWGSELDTLVSTGSVEILAQFTTHGNPITVTL